MSMLYVEGAPMEGQIMANMKPETELASVASRLLREIREQDIEYAWTALIGPMARLLRAEPQLEGLARLGELRRRAFDLAKYSDRSGDGADPAAAILFETEGRSPAFEAAVSQAGRAAMLAVDGHLTISRTRAANGRTYLTVPWRQLQPMITAGAGGGTVENTSDAAFRVTVAYVNKLYTRVYRPPTRERGNGRDSTERAIAAQVDRIARAAAVPESNTGRAATAAMARNLQSMAEAFAESVYAAANDLTEDETTALELLRDAINEVLDKSGARRERDTQRTASAN